MLRYDCYGWVTQAGTYFLVSRYDVSRDFQMIILIASLFIMEYVHVCTSCGSGTYMLDLFKSNAFISAH